MKSKPSGLQMTITLTWFNFKCFRNAKVFQINSSVVKSYKIKKHLNANIRKIDEPVYFEFLIMVEVK